MHHYRFPPSQLNSQRQWEIEHWTQPWWDIALSGIVKCIVFNIILNNIFLDNTYYRLTAIKYLMDKVTLNVGFLFQSTVVWRRGWNLDPDWRPKLQTSKYPLQEVQDNVALGMIIRWQVAKRTICEDSFVAAKLLYTRTHCKPMTKLIGVQFAQKAI